MARRYDNAVDKKRMNSCVLKHLFWRELSNRKHCQKNPEMLSETRYECHVFKILRLTPQKTELRSAQCFETALRAVLINSNQFELIRGQRF